jgi:PAS domain-containing protein
MSTSPDYARVFQALPNPYMVVDHELRYVAANDAYLRATSVRLEELLGKKVLELFPNDPSNPNNRSARMLRDSLQKVLATGQPDTLALIPYRVFREVGSASLTEERFWSATHTPLLDERGRVQFIVQHTVDVTDLERARSQDASAGQPAASAIEAGVLSRAERVQADNQRLHEQRRELLELFDQAPGFLCFLRTREHVFELANQAYLNLVGRRDVVGKTVAQELPEVAGQGFVALLDRVYASGEAFVGTGVRVMLDDGRGEPQRETFLDFIYQPVRDPNGEVIGILVQGMDVTARMRAEAASEEARRAAEAFAAEMEAQSRAVQAALQTATQRIRELEAKVSQS